MLLPESSPLSPITRRQACGLLAAAVLATPGCGGGGSADPHAPAVGELQAVWGKRGTADGRFQKPRAMAIDAADNLYIVDMTARIQVFTPEGEFLRSWSTPDHQFGRPTGLTIDHDGNLLVADTHYYRLLVYSPTGELLKIIGGQRGHAPGEFGLVTDAVRDSTGCLYISEYGEYDRIQKFSRTGDFVLQWGGHGSELGKFVRPQNLEIDADDRIWVADACNHRIQVFNTSGKLLFHWGQQGSAEGELYYPYDLCLAPGDTVYVLEYGNNRVQKFTRDGRSLGCWGRGGRKEGEMHNPWAIVRDTQGRLHVLDSNNHRLQRIVM